MYASLQLPWSENASAAETAFRDAGFVKTKGSLFINPPSLEDLITAFNEPPRPKTRMSSGAVALCKHFERGEASSEHGIAHPFWPLPVGSNAKKTELAQATLTDLLSDLRWKNIMLLHPGVAVYEIRNSLGYGMRWTLRLKSINASTETNCANVDTSVAQNNDDGTAEAQDAKIENITFRGFLEPIIGLDGELAFRDASEG